MNKEEKLKKNKRRPCRVIVFFALFLFIFPVGARASDVYFVDSMLGNDAWSGKLSDGSGNADFSPINCEDDGNTTDCTDGPWRTINKVNNASMNAGDDVYFKRGGTYDDAGILLDWTGVSIDWVIIGAYGSGAKPIIDNNASLETGIDNSGYYRVENIDARSTLGGNCLYFHRQNLSNIIVTNNDFHGCFNAVFIQETNTFEVTNNAVLDSINNGIYIGGSVNLPSTNGLIEGNTVTNVERNDAIVFHRDEFGNNAGANHIVQNNTVSGAYEQGIDLNTGLNFLVENNISHDNNQGAIQSGAIGAIIRYNTSRNDSADSAAAFYLGGENHEVYYNVMYGNTTYHNMSIIVPGTSISPITNNISIHNNTFIQGVNSILDMGDDTENIIWKNNILHNRGGNRSLIRNFDTDRPLGYAGYSFDRNIYYAPSADNRHFYNGLTDNWYAFSDLQTTFNRDATSIESDPSFIDFSEDDFSLQATSPAIDAGVDFGKTQDILGNPIYGLPDIGAYEYQPPYTMEDDGVSLTAAIRMYGDEKFRNKETPSDAGEADISVSLPDTDQTQWLDIDIELWENSDTEHKQWTESTTVSGVTNTEHEIGDLEANKNYRVSVDGTQGLNISGASCVNGVCRSDELGKIYFTYTGTYSNHTFDVEQGNEDAAEAVALTTQQNTEEKKKKKKYDITNSQKNIKVGSVLTQTGRRFSKNAEVKLFFEKSKGVYYDPVVVKTNSKGVFSVKYTVKKKPGAYKWYAIDTKTGRKTSLVKYRVRE